MDIDSLRLQLAAARADLIAALEGASESDFNAELAPGVTIVTALAGFAREERSIVTEARRLAGVASRPSPAVHGEPARRFTPPPVIHDLAGARHETSLLLDTLAAADQASGDGIEAAAALVFGVVEAERDLSSRIAARIGQRPEPPAA